MGESLVTYGELYRWLASGNGAYRIMNCPHVLFSSVFCSDENALVEGVLVRKWLDSQWHEPTSGYMGLEG